MLHSIKGDTDKLMKRVDALAEEAQKQFQEMIHGIKTEELRELWRSLRELEGKSQLMIRKSIEDEIAWWKSSEDDQRKLRSLKNKVRVKKRKDTVRFAESENEDGRKINTSDEEDSEIDDAEDHVLEKEPVENVQGDEFGGWLFRMQEYSDWIKYPQGLLWLHGNCRNLSPRMISAVTDSRNYYSRLWETGPVVSFVVDDLEWLLIPGQHGHPQGPQRKV